MWFHLRLLERCNLNCKSCYAKTHDKSLDIGLVKDILEIVGRVKVQQKDMSVIYLSGGEPLLHPQFDDILEFVSKKVNSITILTNGLLIPQIVKDLEKYSDSLCVQVSLDGDRSVNDSIRGKGVYDRAVEALYKLEQHKIKHWISYTVSALNAACYKDILDLALKTGSVFNNVTPYTGEPALMLGYYEWKEFKYNLGRYAEKIGLAQAHGPNCCGFSYNCGAFYSGITVNPDGNVAGCARINNVKGNYRHMEEYLLDKPLSIHNTCMQKKWGHIHNFKFISLLE
jgi:MoaA/NifB/PqqE/SkfB family radical SAM enzyme